MNSGFSTNAFITKAIFDLSAPRTRRAPPLDHAMAAMLLSQAARINDRLQSSPLASDPSQSGLLLDCRDELVEIRTCLMHVLGRDP